jgi:hypothetical protein
MNPSLDSFETALLTQLRERVEQRPVVGPRRSRPRLLIAAAAMVATAATVVVVQGLSTTAAYSVQEGNAGTITVEVRRLEDAHGLEVDLAKYGVTADITYLPRRQQCAPGRYTAVDRGLAGMQVSIGSRLLRVTLPSGTVHDGETFVMAVSGEAVAPASSQPSQDGVTDRGGFSSWTDFNVASGPVDACHPVPRTIG